MTELAQDQKEDDEIPEVNIDPTILDSFQPE
jgi:hypothetical protein